MRRLLGMLLVAWVAVAWADPTTRHVWVPGRPLDGATNLDPYAGGVPECTSWTPTLGITGATEIAWWTDAGGAGAKCGVAVYVANGSSQLATTGGVDCSAAGPKIMTGIAAFDLTLGVKYTICSCGDPAHGGYSLLARNPGGTSATRKMEQNLSVPQIRTAANLCDVNGNPPATTGTLTVRNRDPILVLISTGTP